ncbi:hypothetical protein TWF706_001100 [Orbilia oligospora]|nr:hypothetical protein TWF706_001100 [Orbilia oligospora]
MINHIIIVAIPALLVCETKASSDSSASEWDEFANNFATDIAPIAVLFGEQITKQFLSESTSVLDHIIFAVAPLGVLTAVVSVIRVCGSSSLKAFVGRAQEAHGISEAELCSSTSRDVCELWSNGGISRIFGRPRILEFVFSGKGANFYTRFPESSGTQGSDKITIKHPSCGIYELRDFFCRKGPDGCEAPESDHWNEIDPESTESTDQTSSSPLSKTQSNAKPDEEKGKLRFAPHPNLSLNIGIRAPPRWVHWAVAVFGVLLQLSFFGYATWASYYATDIWEDGKPPRKWAFPLATVGTGLLVIGMGLCAMLIDRRTNERRFQKSDPLGSNKKVGPSQPPQTMMFWLQPGNQSIGDQVFTAFAHWEKKDKYVTSWRADQPKKTTYIFTVWPAIAFSTSGFILQFIGLRGLHGSVALYQLAATLIMAFIRAMLRSKRIDEGKNRIKDYQDIEGHELDWIALQIDTAVYGNDQTPGTSKAQNKSPNPPVQQQSNTTNRPTTEINHVTTLEVQENKRDPSLENSKNLQIVEQIPADGTPSEQGNIETTTSARRGTEPSPQLNDTIPNFGWYIVDPEATDYATKESVLESVSLPEVTKEGASESEPKVKNVSSSPSTPHAHRHEVVPYIPAPSNNTDRYECARRATKWIEAHEREENNSEGPIPENEEEQHNQSIKPNRAARILHYRHRLAHLTSSITLEPDMRWDTEVRAVSAKLRQAIEAIVEHIFSSDVEVLSKWKGAEALVWSSACQLDSFGKPGTGSSDYLPIHFLLYREKGRWTINQHQLEAVLGLWHWSLKSQTDLKKFPGKKVLVVTEAAKKEDMKSIIRLWISQTLLVTEHEFISDNSVPMSEYQDIISVAASTFPKAAPQVMLLAPSASSSLELIAQDIFTMFIKRISGIIGQLKEVEIRTRKPQLQRGTIGQGPLKDNQFLGLTEPNVEILVEKYIAAGLGTREAALASIIPCFLHHKKMLISEEVARQLLRVAQLQRRSGNFQKCEDILEGLFQLWDQDTLTPAVAVLAVRSFGELYRACMTSQEPQDRDLGSKIGLKFNNKNFMSGSTDEVKETLDNYKEVVQYFSDIDTKVPKPSHNLDITDKVMWKKLEHDLMNNEAKTFALLLKRKYNLHNASYEQSSKVIKWAIQNNTPELIEDLWTATTSRSEELWRDLATDETPLFWAVKIGCNLQTFQSVMEWPGAKVGSRSENGSTAFLEAVKRNNIAYVQALIKAGVDVTVQQFDGHNALHIATARGNFELVELLLDKGVDVNIKNKSGEFGGSAALIAASKGHSKILELLINRGAAIDKNDASSEALRVAASEGYHEVAQALLNKDVDCNAPGGKYGNALNEAAHNLDERMMELLLKHGAAINAKSEKYGTALYIAAKINQPKLTVINLLLDNRINVNAEGGKYGHALSAAVYKGNMGVVELLLNSKANVNAQGGRFGNALSSAASTHKYNRPKLVQLLLKSENNRITKYDADVNAQDGQYRTALIAAVYNNNWKTAELLLKYGADVNTQGRQYGTALIAAVYNNNWEMVELLLKQDGNALNASLFKGHIEMARQLLNSGARVNAQAGEYGNALNTALVSKGDLGLEMYELLIGFDVDVHAQGGRYGNALNTSLFFGSIEMAKRLLKLGVDVHAQGGEYGNALNSALASRRGNTIEMVQLLLEYGAEVNTQGGKYGNALNTAAATAMVISIRRYGLYRDIGIIEKLLEHNADVYAQGGLYGNSLQSAASGGDPEVVQLLLSKGVDINAHGGKYGNALNAAVAKERTGALQILLDNGAKIVADSFPYDDEEVEVDERKGYVHRKIIELLGRKPCEKCESCGLKACDATLESCKFNWIHKAGLEDPGPPPPNEPVTEE